MIEWVQGIRPDDDVPDDDPPWTKTLYLRLTGQLDQAGRGVKTIAAERILGIEESSYYYLGYCHPEFGDLVVAHRPKMRSEATNFRTSPFDTGGLAHDFIPTFKTLNRPQKSELVRRQTHDGNAYWLPFSTWINQSFRSIAHYVRGQKPAKTYVDVIDIDATDDPRAWVWEGRLLALSYSKHPLPARRIFASELQVREYANWIRETKVLERASAAAHVRHVRRLSKETNEPVTEMQKYLSRKTKRVSA